MRTLIIIPTYNEIDTIELLIGAIFQVTPEEVEVLIVDDNSPDGTGQLVDSLAKQSPHGPGPKIHVLHRLKKAGLGSAYVAGFQWGLQNQFDDFIEMDADFSHDPKYLPRMLELLKSYDGVIGSRYVTGGGILNWGVGRRLLSRGGSFYSRMILNAPIQDFTGGFNGWRRRVLEAINLSSLKSDGYSFQIELKYRAFLSGFQLIEFPIVFEDRKVGQSKMNRKIVLEALGRVLGFRLKTVSTLLDKIF